MTFNIALDFSDRFSIESKSRKPSPLKTCLRYFHDPDLIFLGGGLPRSVYFPWDNLSIETPSPELFKNGIIAANDEASKIKALEAGIPRSKLVESNISAGAEDQTPQNSLASDNLTVVNLWRESVHREDDIPMSRALQYGYSGGHPEFCAFIREHTNMIHKVRYDDWDVFSTIGNTSAWEMTLRIFCNKGDVVLAEEFSFTSSIAAAEAQGVVFVPVPLDEYGLIPEELEALMSNWETECEGLPRPKLLYTVPTGQNPTGTCLPADRRAKIYEIAKKYDFLIVEDEPYYFLQMDPYVEESSRGNRSLLTREKLLESLVPSFLSLDTEGRVIRLDSFSKVLAPGSRLGWIVASKSILQEYLKLQELSVQSPSGFAAAIITGTLTRWGQQGYLDWLSALRYEYTLLRDVAMDALNKYLPGNVPFIKVNPTIAGMFFTVTIDASAHPDFESKYGKDPLKLENAIFEVMISRGVLIVPGVWFHVHRQPNQKYWKSHADVDHTFFYRGTFAAVHPDKLTEGIKRLGETLREEFRVE